MGLVNATNGNISAKYEYGPFGEVFCSVGDMAKVNPFQFSTKYTDTETDLVYYGYRYYSPALGRWMSRDPIEEQGGLNLYGFVNNDPVNRWDKLGLGMFGGPRGPAPSVPVGLPPGFGLNIPPSIPQTDNLKDAVACYKYNCKDEGQASTFDCYEICMAFYGNMGNLLISKCVLFCTDCELGKFILKNPIKK